MQMQCPLDLRTLRGLLVSLELALADDGCDHKLRATTRYLNDLDLNVDSVLPWLAQYGGYCDCSVLDKVGAAWSEKLAQ